MCESALSTAIEASWGGGLSRCGNEVRFHDRRDSSGSGDTDASLVRPLGRPVGCWYRPGTESALRRCDADPCHVHRHFRPVLLSAIRPHSPPHHCSGPQSRCGAPRPDLLHPPHRSARVPARARRSDARHEGEGHAFFHRDPGQDRSAARPSHPATAGRPPDAVGVPPTGAVAAPPGPTGRGPARPERGTCRGHPPAVHVPLPPRPHSWSSARPCPGLRPDPCQGPVGAVPRRRTPPHRDEQGRTTTP